MWSPPPDHPLRRLFAGVTEQTFQTRLGVADPPLIDYLSALLARFVHIDGVYSVKDGDGQRPTLRNRGCREAADWNASHSSSDMLYECSAPGKACVSTSRR